MSLTPTALTPGNNGANQGWLVAALLAVGLCPLLATERLQGLLLNSALLAMGTIAISLPLGSLLAVVISKTELPGRRLVEGSLIGLLFVPLYVQAAAWQVTVGQGGWILPGVWLTGWRGAIWVHGMAAIPWVVVLVASALRRLPREWEEAALQDASAGRVLWRVGLRFALPSLAGAALWVAVICFSEIVVTDLFQVRTFAEEIYTTASLGTLGVMPFGGSPVGGTATDIAQLAARDLWLGLLVLALLVLSALLAIRNAWTPLDFSSAGTESSRFRDSFLPLKLATWATVVAVIVFPLLGLVGKSGEVMSRVDDRAVRTWSAAKAATLVLQSPWQHRREFGWSLSIGLIAAALAVALAIFIAWLLRTKRLPTLPTALLLALAFAIPGPLLGVWLIRILNRPPDSLFWPLAWCYDHTLLAPVLAQLTRALPLATLIVGAQFASVPQDVLDSARSEGAGWWNRLWLIALPASWPGLAAAVCLSLVVALGELSATLLVVPPGVSPLSVRVLELLHYGAEDRVSALCLTLAVLLAGLSLLATKLPDWLNPQR